jgi:hypothetical protein
MKFRDLNTLHDFKLCVWDYKIYIYVGDRELLIVGKFITLDLIYLC